MFRKSGLFFRHWLKTPKSVGAIVPSSDALAAAMARGVPKRDGYVIELGGGTGVITQGLLNSGIKPEKLIVVERDPLFHDLLVKRFPKLNIIKGNATDLQSLVRPLGVNEAIAIISGLPLIGMPKPVQHQIMNESKALMGAESPFIQFTYSFFCPLDREGFKIHGRRLERVFNNIPPASVWAYYKNPNA